MTNSTKRLHLSNIYKPALEIPLETDCVIEVNELSNELIKLIQKGVFIEE